MSTLEYPVYHNRHAVTAAVEKAIVTTVAPALKAAIEDAAAAVAAEFGEDSPVVRYILAEKLLEETASLLMMSDTSETDVLRPHMLAPDFVIFFYPNVKDQA